MKPIRSLLFHLFAVWCVVDPALSIPVVWMDDICGISKYADAGEMYLPSPAVVGGKTTREYEFPWQVSLRLVQSNSHYCGGSIINNQWIVTAGHCAEDMTAGSIRVVVGQHDRTAVSSVRQIFDVSTIVLHPRYDEPIKHQNDVALLRIYGNITFNENVRPICPPTAGELYEGRKCVVSGWGTLYYGSKVTPTELQYTTLNVTTNAACVNEYSSADTVITADMLCTSDNGGNKDRDSCQGDSGGPATVKDVNGTFHLIGLVSFGIGCAQGYPGVNARVSHFLDWIANTIITDVSDWSPGVTKTAIALGVVVAFLAVVVVFLLVILFVCRKQIIHSMQRQPNDSAGHKTAIVDLSKSDPADACNPDAVSCSDVGLQTDQDNDADYDTLDTPAVCDDETSDA